MEVLTISINKREEFSKAIAEGLPEMGDLRVITKDGGTTSGSAVAVIAFTAVLENEKGIANYLSVQSVTTVKLLLGLLATLDAFYTSDGKRKFPDAKGN